ncbi:VapE domain-containing protein [Sphingomonas silueang]|uniref:VapE domain-containing protein n=1 Tax=Sphingomonas silueang TaxID=3156617 RepID=UPI0032B3FC1C
MQSLTDALPAEGAEPAPPVVRRVIPIFDYDDFPDPPSKAGQGLPATVDNLGHLLKEYGITVRFDVLKKRPMVDIPGFRATGENRDAVVLTYVEDLAIRHRMSTRRVAQNLLALADRSPVDPFARWIDSKPWDGEDRLPDLYETVAPQEGYPVSFRDTLLRKWLLSIVAATFKKRGFRARGALTFQGDQGIGKTSWFKQLVSDDSLRDQTVKLGHAWDGGSKDARLSAIRHRIVELGELEGSFRREIAGLKAFLTEDYDKIRPPYGRVDAEYPRRTIFGASVNESDFLLDATGNSRFWTIAVAKLDYEHSIDMQQLFAQLKKDFEAGAKWHLEDEEEQQLEAVNRQHRHYGAIGEKIKSLLDLSGRGLTSNPRDSAGDVLRKIGVERPTNIQFKEANAILKELLGGPKKIQGVYRWYVPWDRSQLSAKELYANRRTNPENEEY